MANYVVSARKYRPMRFDEVVGQNHVSNTLKNALKTDHLGHSFLFCGPRGVGKTTSARILAKVLNCENRTEDFEPCNTCSSCTAFNQNQSFNIYELDAASNNSVDNMRDLVEQVRFAPQQGAYKVYIIDEVHMLSAAAFNAFLKTLEEPPSYAIFILATTEKHKIIPTILSRCQIFDFNRVQVKDIVIHLQSICNQEGIKAEDSALHIIAEKADGALRDALSIFDRIISLSGKNLTTADVNEGLNLLDVDTYFELTNHLLLQDKNQTLLLFDQVLKNGFDGDQLMLGLGEHFRDLLVVKEPSTRTLMQSSTDLKEKFILQSEKASMSFLLNALNIANQCDLQFKQAKNKRLHVELALLKMCYLSTLKKDVPVAVEPLESKKKLDEPIIKDEIQPLKKTTVEEKDNSKEESIEVRVVPPQHELYRNDTTVDAITVASDESVEISNPVETSNRTIEQIEIEETIDEQKKLDVQSEIEKEEQSKELFLEATGVEVPLKSEPSPRTIELELEQPQANVEPTPVVPERTPEIVESPIPEVPLIAESKKQQFASKMQPALSFRLSQLNAEVAKKKERSIQKEEAEKNDIVLKNPVVTNELVANAWYSIGDKVQSASLIKGIADSKVNFENDHIQITVFGKVIKDYLKEHHNLIISTIQEQTGLNSFTYDIECVELDKKNVKTFTKEEELAYVQKQNPAIKKMCDVLNLEIRYD